MWAPELVFSLSLRLCCPIGDRPVCFHPCLYFIPAFSLSPPVCVLCFSLSSFFLPLLPLAHASSISRSLWFFLLCSAWVSCALFFPVLSPLLAFITSSLCFLPATVAQFTKSYVSQKRKKGKKIQNTKKPKQNQISSVLQSAASSRWPLCVSLWPAACPPAPCPSAVCPARLPPPAPPADDTEFSAWVFGDGY